MRGVGGDSNSFFFEKSFMVPILLKGSFPSRSEYYKGQSFFIFCFFFGSHLSVLSLFCLFCLYLCTCLSVSVCVRVCISKGAPSFWTGKVFKNLQEKGSRGALRKAHKQIIWRSNILLGFCCFKQGVQARGAGEGRSGSPFHQLKMQRQKKFQKQAITGCTVCSLQSAQGVRAKDPTNTRINSTQNHKNQKKKDAFHSFSRLLRLGEASDLTNLATLSVTKLLFLMCFHWHSLRSLASYVLCSPFTVFCLFLLSALWFVSLCSPLSDLCPCALRSLCFVFVLSARWFVSPVLSVNWSWLFWRGTKLEVELCEGQIFGTAQSKRFLSYQK